jgi:hypothetical protein
VVLHPYYRQPEGRPNQNELHDRVDLADGGRLHLRRGQGQVEVLFHSELQKIMKLSCWKQ